MHCCSEICLIAFTTLTTCGLVMLYGITDFCPHWFRQWLLAWLVQSNGLLPDGTKSLPEMIWIYHQLGPVVFTWVHFSQVMVKISITGMFIKILYLELGFHLPEDSELMTQELGTEACQSDNLQFKMTVFSKSKHMMKLLDSQNNNYHQNILPISFIVIGKCQSLVGTQSICLDGIYIVEAPNSWHFFVSA